MLNAADLNEAMEKTGFRGMEDPLTGDYPEVWNALTTHIDNAAELALDHPELRVHYKNCAYAGLERFITPDVVVVHFTYDTLVSADTNIGEEYDIWDQIYQVDLQRGVYTHLGKSEIRKGTF